MKRQMRWLATSMLFLTTVIVFGRAQSIEMKVKIPFDFVAGDRALAAGEYVVTRLGRGNEAMRLTQTDGTGLATLIPATRVQASGGRDHGKLIFNKYRNHYFLSEVWTANDNVGRRFRRSSQEAEIAGGGASEPVSVLALPERH